LNILYLKVYGGRITQKQVTGKGIEAGREAGIEEGREAGREEGREEDSH
jgi:flagellar biosynthesis/type III secretory pathway protein FliH